MNLRVLCEFRWHSVVEIPLPKWWFANCFIVSYSLDLASLCLSELPARIASKGSWVSTFNFLQNDFLNLNPLLTNTLVSRAFFGHSEKNSSPKKLKTQANSHENSSKISEKLKNRQLNLSFYNINVAFSFQKCAAG